MYNRSIRRNPQNSNPSSRYDANDSSTWDFYDWISIMEAEENTNTRDIIFESYVTEADTSSSSSSPTSLARFQEPTPGSSRMQGPYVAPVSLSSSSNSQAVPPWNWVSTTESYSYRDLAIPMSFSESPSAPRGSPISQEELPEKVPAELPILEEASKVEEIPSEQLKDAPKRQRHMSASSLTQSQEAIPGSSSSQGISTSQTQEAVPGSSSAQSIPDRYMKMSASCSIQIPSTSEGQSIRQAATSNASESPAASQNTSEPNEATISTVFLGVNPEGTFSFESRIFIDTLEMKSYGEEGIPQSVNENPKKRKSSSVSENTDDRTFRKFFKNEESERKLKP